MNAVTAERAWAVLVAAIIVYELAAPRGQLLSEAVDRWLEKRPWPTRLAVIVTAAHLLNVLPDRVDPFTGVGHLSRLWRR